MARITQGTIYQRAVNGKPSKYYSAQYFIENKRFRVVLLDDDGHKITNREAARAALQKLIAPAALSKQTDRRAAHVDALKTITEKLVKVEAEAAAIAEERKNPPLKVVDAWKTYVAPDERLKPDCSDANLKNYRGHWRSFSEWLTEQPENPVLMRDITETLAKRYANYLDSLPVSGNTFNKHRAFLLSFFKALARKTKAESNPFSVIGRKLKVKAAKKRNLNADELRVVLANATGEMGLLLWVGATTGLRLGDAVTLTWGNVDLPRGVIRLDTRKTGTDIILGIVPVLAELLTQMPPEQRQGYIMPELAGQYLNPCQNPHMIARIQRYFQDCGIQTQRPGTGGDTGKRAVTEVGFHSLRHSFATICGDAGTAESVTQKLLGHSRAAMTHYYQHATEHAATDTAKRLDGAFRGLIGETTEAAPEEPERAALRTFADTLPIETIRAILAGIRESAD